MNNKNERILFSSNQIKFTGSLISGLVFVVVGIWFVSIKNITGLNINIAGWLFIILGGLCIVVFIMSLLPNRNYLHLNYEGFTVFSTFRKRSYFWSDVELFDSGAKRMRQNSSEFYPPQLARNLI